MNQKIVVITGAGAGIGKTTAEFFLNKGWLVVATMRNMEKSSDWLEAHPLIFPVYLDVCDFESVDSAINVIVQKFGRIDAWVNNAGYGLIGAFESIEMSQIDRQLDTNLRGLIYCTSKIIPIMKKQKSGTIINLSSIAGKLTFPFFSLYHTTKFAVEGFSETLSHELRRYNIKVRLIEPGPIKTDFYDRSREIAHKEGINDYQNDLNKFIKVMDYLGNTAPGPELVAKVIYKAATNNSYKLRYPVGVQAKFLLFLHKIIPSSILGAMVRKVSLN